MDPVHLEWDDGTSVDVPAIWLRDNCPCPDCRVIATSERRLLIANESLHLSPASVMTDPSGVIVDWGTHVSTYSLDWYRSIEHEVQRRHVPPQFWDAGLSMPTFRYADLDESTAAGRNAVIEFLTSVAACGVAVVTGVPAYRGESERFISRWAPLRELPFGRVHDVWIDTAGYNIAHTAEALPPHTDFASYEWPPSGQLLHMLVNEAVGGDSVVVDGWHLAAQLTPAELDVLAWFEVPFRQFDERSETWTRAPLIQRACDGRVTHLRFSNQLMQPLDPNAPDLEDFYAAFHRFSRLVLDSANQYHFRLDAGDLLLVHGHRVLHGRAAFQPASGRRHLQDVYFEFDDLVNRLYRLQAVPV